MNRSFFYCSIPLGLFAQSVVALADPATEAVQARAAQDPVWAKSFQPPDTNIFEPRSRLLPLFDEAVRDASIVKGSDGMWYLVGNQDADGDGNFQNNPAIYLWRSRNFKDWEKVGEVWNIDQHATAPRSAWQKEMRVNPENPRGPLVRGLVSPSIHEIDGTYYITYSMNHQGTGLLKSETGKPEGPYVDLGRLTEEGADATLFRDDDGTVYWVGDRGFIARLSPDLTALAEPPRLLRPAIFPTPGKKSDFLPSSQAPRTLGEAGAQIFKADGRYWMSAATVRDRLGVGCYDTFVMGSESLDGPWTEPLMMINHGGKARTFVGPNDQLHATFGGRDSRAVFRDKPAAVPLIFNPSRFYAQSTVPAFPRKAFRLFTEFGPWAEMPLVAPFNIRDLQFSKAPDGYVYLTGSGIDRAYADRIMVFRSKNMRDWEPVDVKFDFLSIPGATQEDYDLRFKDERNIASLGAKYMDSEIYFAEGTFHIFTSLYSVNNKRADGSPVTSGGLWLRSTTGKPEGPYEYVDKSPSQNSAFQDDDGKWYIFFNGTLAEWDPKGNSLLSGARHVLKTETGSPFCNGDVATNLAKIHGKYVVFATTWHGGARGENYRVHGTYDWNYWQSDTLLGPYRMPRNAYAIPHAGHSTQPIQGEDGRWYGLLFGNEDTSPWGAFPGVLVLDVRLDKDDTIRIEVKDELP